jgi:hypothetical protein
MSENKSKTRELSLDEVKGFVDDYLCLKMHSIPADTHLIAKIRDKGYTRTIPSKEEGKEDSVLYFMPVTYEKDGVEADLNIRVSEATYKRFHDKYKDQDFIGKHAFFSKTSFNGKFPQFVNVINNFKERVTKDEAFSSKTDVTQDIDMYDTTDENLSFINEYYKVVKSKQVNLDNLKQNIFLGSLVRSKMSEDTFKKILQRAEDMGINDLFKIDYNE